MRQRTGPWWPWTHTVATSGRLQLPLITWGGDVATFLANDQYDLARTCAGEFQDLFGEGRYWLEVQDHGIHDVNLA